MARKGVSCWCEDFVLMVDIFMRLASISRRGTIFRGQPRRTPTEQEEEEEEEEEEKGY